MMPPQTKRARYQAEHNMLDRKVPKAARYPRWQDIIHDSNVPETARHPKQQDTQDSKIPQRARHARMKP